MDCTSIVVAGSSKRVHCGARGGPWQSLSGTRRGQGSLCGKTPKRPGLHVKTGPFCKGEKPRRSVWSGRYGMELMCVSVCKKRAGTAYSTPPTVLFPMTGMECSAPQNTAAHLIGINMDFILEKYTYGKWRRGYIQGRRI